ncbi:crossover junction endodeoxyribonuclease RuvC [Oceanicoccus sp. KOV_DT_Chl]|uniref:crossover junction endodeoxyribonuclease RuvC n=1 Tax=Oceanicoccus sp. KOV_DT_Chl TaxID=1904639 RepID=UPI000C7E4580|nr:crossover junction endodeoxyribonuclease RuvC [Oceanicoccus sp. KOV_DT_Chl]
MSLILGIDPGSRKTGFGIINVLRDQHEYVASGVIKLPVEHDLPDRIKVLIDSLAEIIETHCPQQVAIEQVFMAKNAGSALKLGQARGAAIAACVAQQLTVAEYSARQIKQAVVGSGAANKEQVQHMVKTLLKLPAMPQEDAADALAAAICHAHTRASLINLAGVSRIRRGRMR